MYVIDMICNRQPYVIVSRIARDVGQTVAG